MNWTAVRAIVAKDLLTVRRNTGVLVPMIVVPVVLVAVLPLAAFGISRVDEGLGEFRRLLDMVPQQVLEGLPEQPSARLAVILATFVVPPLLLIVPLMVASVLGTDSIAGERERNTLEGLLLAPVEDRDIFVGKLLGALVPALLIGVAVSAAYAVIVNGLFWSVAGGPVLPTPSWLLLVLWLGPAFTTLALAVTVVVSARAKSVQAASQISGLAVIPLVALTLGQLGGLVLLVWWVTLLLGAVLLVVAAGLLRTGAKALSRDRQVSSSV